MKSKEFLCACSFQIQNDQIIFPCNTVYILYWIYLKLTYGTWINLESKSKAKQAKEMK